MKESIQMYIGSKIRKMREKKGIGIREFEVMTGISRSELSKIETGKRNPTMGTLERIAEALNCELEFLLKEKK